MQCRQGIVTKPQGAEGKNPGVDPGYLSGQIVPAYHNAPGSLQNEYYWGIHPELTGSTGVGQQWNSGIPTTPYGQQYSAVGGNEYLNIPNFIQTFIPQAALGAGTYAHQPYVAPYNPPAGYSTTATQNITSPIGQIFGGAAANPYPAVTMPYLTPINPVAPAGATNAGQPTSG